MGYSEGLAERVRRILQKETSVVEKKMFGGLAFMVKDKMCVTIGENRIMCRIDPEQHEQALEKAGTATVVMGKRSYKGYIHVTEEQLHSDEDLEYWVALALEYNPRAPIGKKK